MAPFRHASFAAFLLAGAMLTGCAVHESDTLPVAGTPEDQGVPPTPGERVEIVNDAKALLDDWSGDTSQLDAAHAALRRVLRFNERNVPALIQLSRVESRRAYVNGQNYNANGLALARQHVRKAIRIDPDSFDAHLYLAWNHSMSRDYDGVRDELAIAERLRPGDPELRWIRASVAMNEYEFDEAIRLTRSILDETDDGRLRNGAYSVLIQIARTTGNWDMADSAYAAVLELKPDSPWTHVNYAGYLVSRQEWDPAIEHAERALSLMDFGMGRAVLARACVGKAFALERGKDRARACELYDRAATVFPYDADAMMGVGMCHFRRSQRNDDLDELEIAVNAFRTVKALDPQNTSVDSYLRYGEGRLVAEGRGRR